MSSLDTALHILGSLSAKRPVLRVGELCRDLGIPKSSASRLLRTLGDSGLLEHDPRERGYVAGPRSVLIANLYLSRNNLIDLADEALRGLVEEFGYTGYLSKLDGEEIVLLRVRQGAYPLRYVRETGSRLAAVRTAMGRVLLARASSAAIDAIVERYGRDLAAKDRTSLKRSLAEARSEVVFRAESSLMPGVLTMAATVADAERGEVLALALAYPEAAVNAADEARMRSRLVAVSASMAHRISGNEDGG